MEMVMEVEANMMVGVVVEGLCTLLEGQLELMREMSWKEMIELMTEAYCLRNEIQKIEIELMVPEEEDKVERYIWGLLDSIHGNVTSAGPVRFQDVVKLANSLMDQKVRTYVARQADNKRRLENTPRDNHVRQPPFKRHNVVGPTLLGLVKRVAMLRAPMVNQRNMVTCYDCGKQGNYKSDCSKLKNQNHGNTTGNAAGSSEAHGRVYA
nr:hypothetical protein [Tanacetum cinerariifolium]